MTPRFYSKLFAALLMSRVVVSPVCADIAYEGFDYPVGQNLAGQNGGSGFTSAWSVTGGGSAIVSGSLVGPTEAGNSATVTPTSGTVYAVRSFSTLNSGTVYFSFLIDNLNDGSRFIAVPLWYNNSEMIYLGQVSGGATWNINKGGGALGADGGGNTSFSTFTSEAVRLVLRIDFDAGGANATSGGTSDVLRLYVNPAVDAAEPATAAAIVSTWDLPNGINQIRLGAGYDNGVQTTAVGGFDEVRIAHSWSAVLVPEPSSVLALAGGALMMANLRPRRRRSQLGTPDRA